MKKTITKVSFVCVLLTVLAIGATVTSEPADARHNCPLCYVPPGASGWSNDGCCNTGTEICVVQKHYLTGQRCVDYNQCWDL